MYPIARHWLVSSFLATLLSAMVSLHPTTADEYDSEPFRLEYVRGENSVTVVGRNDAPGDITVTVRCETANMDASEPLPLTAVVGAGTQQTLCVLTVRDTDQTWRWQSKYNWRWGRYNAKHDDSYVYTLPFATDQPIEMGQSYGGSYSHQGRDHYSLDFHMPEGTPICAARTGTVVRVVSHFSEGGPSRSYIDKCNLIAVFHADGTVARYVHLQMDGVRVKVGDRVRAGQLIGLSGNTGWSTTPHLHFHVERPIDGSDYLRLPTRFYAVDGYVTEFHRGNWYTRPSQATITLCLADKE